MVKLKELLKLDNIRYSDSIKPKHQKRMDRPLKHIHNPIIPYNPPPTNSSKVTIDELHWLLNFNDGKISNDVVMKGDDIEKVFENYCEENSLDYPKKYIKELIKDSGRIIYELKYKYNRARPFQLGEFYNIPDFKIHKLDSAKTPSYPSGHSTQGIFISKVFGKMYPTHEKHFNKLGKMISHSRLMASAHFPSDTKFGEKVGNLIFNNIKGKIK